ncbi:putative selenate reductase subunit YgfK [Oscillospiraceae bacterium 50-16]
MSDIMRPIPFGSLMDWILEEYRSHKTVFSVPKGPVYQSARPMFRETVEVPLGPAAGPHTQLAQNIIAAYVSGARFFELKTVQIMDGEELSKCVNKPCITAGDECYNCEWSTELTVPQAFEEYVKAWFACKLLSRELDLGSDGGFVFNMSVGYDLAGIKSPKIDKYINEMMDASATPVFQSCKQWALDHLDRFSKVDAAFVEGISPVVSQSITESTLHGCPPAEIEGIASYLISEKGLHTYVKCNPTLLGYETARDILDRLGFDYVTFDDHHFKEDLQWADAVPMFRRLQALAAEHGVDFGVKLTNTFPVDVAAGELPSEEMYMSGRSLFPLSITLAAMLSKEFDGKLRVSYSGGADIHSIKSLAQAGIWPITVATTLLKPGGYQRFHQLGQELDSLGGGAWNGVDPEAAAALARGVFEDGYYRKPIKTAPGRKLAEKVPLTSCFTAPCRGGCPIHQDIPTYLRLVREGNYAKALEVITQRNPLPFITGTICPHHCTDKCTRDFYEEPVSIRDAKLKAAEGGFAQLLPELKPKAPRKDVNVAIVGGGPAGMAAAFFLGREGVPVTIYEASDKLGGVVRHIIPDFRISAGAIDRDEAIIRTMGVTVNYNSPVASAAELEGKGYTHILFATGAQKHGDPRLEYGEYLNFTQVLSTIKKGEAPDLGTDVAVIGGGNSAMDTARAVKRLPGVEHVRLVYRRTKKQMPAEEEELQLALAEGVEFLELMAPAGVKDGVLTCKVMKLGEPDASGRRAPVPTGETVELPCTTLIAAVGEKIDESVDVGSWPVIGDRKRGPATVVEAIADAAQAVEAILSSLDLDKFAAENGQGDTSYALTQKGTLCADCSKCGSGERCLECATICQCCVDVCPNRANMAVQVPGVTMPQIVHVDGMCNECGNCAIFCPYDSAPYRDKLTLFWSREDFDNSSNQGWLPLEDTRCLVRLEGQVRELDVSDPGCRLDETIRQLILTVRKDYSWLLAK